MGSGGRKFTPIRFMEYPELYYGRVNHLLSSVCAGEMDIKHMAMTKKQVYDSRELGSSGPKIARGLGHQSLLSHDQCLRSTGVAELCGS